MKLIAKISINYFIMTALVLICGGAVAYFFIKSEVDEEIDQLLHRERNFIRQMATVPELRRHDLSSGNRVDVMLTQSADLAGDALTDTVIAGGREGQMAFRQLRFIHTIGDSAFLVVVRKPEMDSDTISEGMLPGMAVVGIGVLLVLMVTNYISSRRIWQPFRRTVQKISQYDITRTERLDLPAAETDEFNQLNKALNEMSDRIQSDYLSLKEFSENASHEIQTPLAIIRSRADLLIQSDKLDGDMIRHLEAIGSAATKLSRLNQALLLLAKIENRQFVAEEQVDLLQVIKKQVDSIEELTQMKSHVLEMQLESLSSLRMSPVLADILVQNLVANAVKYTPTGGRIRIHIENGQLAVANTGQPLSRAPEELFERFVKENQSAESLGLGLAIVKRICDNYGFRPTYTFSDNMHIFTILF